MSMIQDIIQHSIDKNPLAMKEALEEEMRNRVAAAIQDKMLSDMQEATDEDDMDDQDEDDADDEDEDDMDEAACVREMKKLHASACTKTEMYAKIKEKYGCSKARFEGLYASYCND